jgi:hypothetical protein
MAMPATAAALLEDEFACHFPSHSYLTTSPIIPAASGSHLAAARVAVMPGAVIRSTGAPADLMELHRRSTAVVAAEVRQRSR